jgi:hypothetical protein
VNVAAEIALETAHLAALRKRLANTPDPQTSGAIRDLISNLEKRVAEMNTGRTS